MILLGLNCSQSKCANFSEITAWMLFIAFSLIMLATIFDTCVLKIPKPVSCTFTPPISSTLKYANFVPHGVLLKSIAMATLTVILLSSTANLPPVFIFANLTCKI